MCWVWLYRAGDARHSLLWIISLQPVITHTTQSAGDIFTTAPTDEIKRLPNVRLFPAVCKFQFRNDGLNDTARMR